MRSYIFVELPTFTADLAEGSSNYWGDGPSYHIYFSILWFFLPLYTVKLLITYGMK